MLPFSIFFQVMFDMGPPISSELQVVSFHTVSKGYWGECGQRGGYFEMTNLPPKVICRCSICQNVTCPKYHSKVPSYNECMKKM
jgi:aspartate/methionine/tyrosine aminotransferase